MKKFNFYLLKYEFFNTLLNGYSIAFGLIMPIFLCILISGSVLSDVPISFKGDAATGLFLGFAMLIPLACVFLSHAASYSNEVEKQIPQRINLFGISNSQFFWHKVLSTTFFVTFCLIIYALSLVFILPIKMPTPIALMVWLVAFYVLSYSLLMLAHGISLLVGKFGLTYAISMGLYFFIMIVSGYMGLRASQMPAWLQRVGDLLPTKILGSEEIVSFWGGNSYNFAPLIQSFVFFTSVCIIVLLISFRKIRRV